MFGLFGKSKRKKEIKSTFKEYGYEIQKFNIDGYGEVDFANWLHPFNRPIHLGTSEVNFYKSLAPVGSMIIDIGTYTGDTTVPMALAGIPMLNLDFTTGARANGKVSTLILQSI
uniref:hypothetical protein n=1 Tax=Roseivirga sp. TaxID=1964215 RepID=UPI004047E27C